MRIKCESIKERQNVNQNAKSRNLSSEAQGGRGGSLRKGVVGGDLEIKMEQKQNNRRLSGLHTRSKRALSVDTVRIQW